MSLGLEERHSSGDMERRLNNSYMSLTDFEKDMLTSQPEEDNATKRTYLKIF